MKHHPLEPFPLLSWLWQSVFLSFSVWRWLVGEVAVYLLWISWLEFMDTSWSAASQGLFGGSVVLSLATGGLHSGIYHSWVPTSVSISSESGEKWVCSWAVILFWCLAWWASDKDESNHCICQIKPLLGRGALYQQCARVLTSTVFIFEKCLKQPRIANFFLQSLCIKEWYFVSAGVLFWDSILGWTMVLLSVWHVSLIR
jgi:hypothetical protein